MAQAVLLITLLYAGMSGVRHAVRTSRLYPVEGDRPNVPIGGSSNTPFQSAWLCMIKNEGSYAYGGTRDVLFGDVDGQSAW